jgi:hypothetical protein
VSGDQRISNGAWFVPDTTPEVTSTVRAVADGEGFNHDCGRSYGSLLHTFRMKWKCSLDRRCSSSEPLRPAWPRGQATLSGSVHP